MRKNVGRFLVVVLLLIFIVVFFGLYNEYRNKNIEEVCFDTSCFNVEIADDNQERAQGLMFRNSLEESSGMLFIFDDSGKYSFWMKNTLIPLEIIWINKNLEVVHIVNAIPCTTEECESYTPVMDALYVLEINSGKSEENNIRVGDKVTFK